MKLGVRLATFSAVAEIGIHLYLLPDHLQEKPYIGWLFAASAFALTAVVVGLVEPGIVRAAAYLAGTAICVAMFGGFVASRTVGLPLGYHEGWLMDDSLGIVSLVFEVVFVACAACAWRPARATIAACRSRFASSLPGPSTQPRSRWRRGSSAVSPSAARQGH